MNDEPNTVSAKALSKPQSAGTSLPVKPDKGKIIAGFCSVLGLCLLSLLDRSGTIMLFDTIYLPIAAVILAIIPKTRKFGLGCLLACGTVALILLAICGGLMVLK